MDQPQFIDAETYSGGKNDEITFRMIVMEHLRRIMTLASVEWYGGYWAEKPSKAGMMIETYIPATHEAYSNAVDGLADLLHPFYDDTMRSAENENTKTLEAKVDEVKKECDGDNSQFQSLWRQHRAKIKRQLFRALSDFLNRKGYLELGTMEE